MALMTDDFHKAGCECKEAGCHSTSDNHVADTYDWDCCVCNGLWADMEGETYA